MVSGLNDNLYSKFKGIKHYYEKSIIKNIDELVRVRNETRDENNKQLPIN